MAGGVILQRKSVRLLGISGMIVAADQITKWMVVNQLPLGRSLPVIPGFFDMTHIQNPGGAFGFLASQSPGIRRGVFLLVSLLAMGLVLHFYRQTPRSLPILSTGFAMIFGGAVGNMIDRLRLGRVVDFLDFYIGKVHWPAFNIADSAISVGVAIFIAHLVLGKLPDS